MLSTPPIRLQLRSHPVLSQQNAISTNFVGGFSSIEGSNRRGFDLGSEDKDDDSNKEEDENVNFCKNKLMPLFLARKTKQAVNAFENWRRTQTPNAETLILIVESILKFEKKEEMHIALKYLIELVESFASRLDKATLQSLLKNAATVFIKISANTQMEKLTRIADELGIELRKNAAEDKGKTDGVANTERGKERKKPSSEETEIEKLKDLPEGYKNLVDPIISRPRKVTNNAKK